MTSVLPQGWATSSLGDIFEILDSLRKPINADERATRRGDVPYYGATGQVGWIDEFLFDEELILLGEDGAPFLDSNKPKAYVIRGKSWVNNHAHVLRAPSSTPSSFWKLQLDTVAYKSFVSGTTRLKLPQGSMKQIQLLVPPCKEQHRLSDILDSYLSRLDNAVRSLESVQVKLRAYRASVLKAAVEGRLVPPEAALARAEKRDYEPADALLARILKERRRRWEEAELTRLKTNGKTPKDDKWKTKYQEPEAPDTSKLPHLPKGWCWTSLSSVIVDGPQNGIYVPKTQYGEGTPILRIDDYQVNWSRSSSELQRVKLSVDDEARFGLSVGDLVLNRVNSPSHLGKTLAVEARHLPAVFESNMMRFRVGSGLAPRFLHFYLSAPQGKQRLTAGAKWAVNQASINQKDVGNAVVPLPPASEQVRLVAEIDRLLSAAVVAAATVEQDASRAVRLRQAVLKWAFEGKLVDQDPNDEHAEKLLARIRAERAAVNPVKKTFARRARAAA